MNPRGSPLTGSAKRNDRATELQRRGEVVIGAFDDTRIEIIAMDRHPYRVHVHAQLMGLAGERVQLAGAQTVPPVA